MTSTTSTAPPPDLTAFLHDGHRAAWSLAALAVGGRPGGATALSRAAQELLMALGLTHALR